MCITKSTILIVLCIINLSIAYSQEEKVIFKPEKIYTLSALHSNKLIGINQALNIVQWDYVGLERQKWVLHKQSGGTFKIVSARNGYCVESLPDNTHAGNIRALPQNNGIEQSWEIKNDGDGYVAFINKFNGFALDVMEGAQENGWIFLNWEFEGNANQLFTIEKINGDTVKIIAKHSGKALTMTASQDEPGANAAQWENVGQFWQQWGIVQLENGFYKIINRHSGMALQLSDENYTQKIDAEQGFYKGLESQQWMIEKKSSDAFAIKNRKSGEYLEVMVVAKANGANVWTYEYNGGENQLFKIEPVNNQSIKN